MCVPFKNLTMKEYFEQVNNGTVSLPDESSYPEEIREQLEKTRQIDMDAAAFHAMSEMGAYNPSSAFEKKYNKKEFHKLKK